MLDLSFSKKIIIKNIIKIFFIIFCFLLIAYFGLNFSITTIIRDKKWLDPMFIIIAATFFLGFILGVSEVRFLDKISNYLDKLTFNLKNAIKGNLGEKKTFEKLQQILGSEYKIYPNFHIPDPKLTFDNDAVIIGPKGIICIEIKNIKGNFDFIEEETYKYYWHNKNQCRETFNEWNSPSKEVLRHSMVLQKWLEKKGINDIRPKPFLLLVGGMAEFHSKPNPRGYYVIKDLEKLPQTLQGTYEDGRFTEELCQSLVGLFGNKYLK